MREVKLYGHLARQFGRVFRFDVASPAEAVQALRANFPGFEAALVGHRPGYRVFVGKQNIGADDLHFQGGSTIKIVPVVAGAGRGGLGQIILGAVLLGLTFWNPLGLFAGEFAALGGLGLKGIGTAMMLGGVAQMLFSPPVSEGPQERPENKPSYAFNGPVNTTAQGNPVPICYGRLMVGSQVISAGLSVEQVAP